MIDPMMDVEAFNRLQDRLLYGDMIHIPPDRITSDHEKVKGKLSSLNGKFVYLAAPYSKGVKGENAHRLVLIADYLMDHGLIVYNPLLSHWHDRIKPRSYDSWTEFDLRWLERCEVMIYVPGESVGVQREIRHAEGLGIPVFEIKEVIGEEISNVLLERL